MMKTIELQITGTNSSKKYYVPLKDPARLVAMYVGTSAGQSSTADVKIGKSGASNTILDADLDGASAGDVVSAAYNSSATDAEKNQIFDLDTPAELDVNLESGGELVVQLVVDPFLIGQHKGF